ncbi:hypothetical protein [Amycolatopsis sp. WAC 04197]|uniref:hypothetical protein n=1 Tax=Amycolatopsis sp. WAC 04197 TaxID=2203199 RepID=UPI00131511AE|nr:hypothetical protein [Amycolatopsis sp. WAC 04197]
MSPMWHWGQSSAETAADTFALAAELADCLELISRKVEVYRHVSRGRFVPVT